MIAEDVRSLVALFNASDLVELRIEQPGRKLFLRKGDFPAPLPPPAPAAPVAREQAIKAHMVGVFYWSRDKSAKPTLSLHQRVERGQVVGFVESMGIMNEIEADHAGQVVEIAVASGQPVEFGQPIVVLQPD